MVLVFQLPLFDTDFARGIIPWFYAALFPTKRQIKKQKIFESLGYDLYL